MFNFSNARTPLAIKAAGEDATIKPNDPNTKLKEQIVKILKYCFFKFKFK